MERGGGRWADLDVSVLGDDLEAVEVGPHLAHVVDHGGDAEDGGVTTIVLQITKKNFFRRK